jgi:hypothetical protein
MLFVKIMIVVSYFSFRSLKESMAGFSFVPSQIKMNECASTQGPSPTKTTLKSNMYAIENFPRNRCSRNTRNTDKAKRRKEVHTIRGDPSAKSS